MADDEEELPPKPEAYKLVANDTEKPTSIGFSGQGTANYMNGDVYEGTFENGARVKGVYRYYRGDVYTGAFVNNLKSGLGTMKYKKGDFYQGYFKNGLRDGEGTFKYKNGDIYSGMWSAGAKHGPGTYVFAGTKYEFKGDWKDGQISQGHWAFTNGTKYVGSFKNQKPCGDGVWHTKDGTIVEGAYVQQVVPVDDEPYKAGDNPSTKTNVFWKTATMVASED